MKIPFIDFSLRPPFKHFSIRVRDPIPEYRSGWNKQTLFAYLLPLNIFLVDIQIKSDIQLNMIEFTRFESRWVAANPIQIQILPLSIGDSVKDEDSMQWDGYKIHPRLFIGSHNLRRMRIFSLIF